VIRILRYQLVRVSTSDAGEDTPQVTAQVGALLAQIGGKMTRQAIQDALGLARREHFRKTYLIPALKLVASHVELD